MNPDLKKLQAYPFEQLAKLKSGIAANNDLYRRLATLDYAT